MLSNIYYLNIYNLKCNILFTVYFLFTLLLNYELLRGYILFYNVFKTCIEYQLK